MRHAGVISALLVWGGCACAADLPQIPLPGDAVAQFEQILPLATLHLPVGPATPDDLPSEPFDGLVETRTWQILPEDDGDVPPVLAFVMPIREALEQAGYDIVLDCADQDCGDFDFRRHVALVPAPDMFLNLRDFRALSARKDDVALSVLASRSGVAGFVQVASVRPAAQVPELTRQSVQDVPFVAPAEEASPLDDGSLVLDLRTDGVSVLTGVVFASGSAVMAGDAVPSLDALVQFLTENPDAVISLVGHTDAVGSLTSNITLSRQRAEAVRAYLVAQAGIDAGRIAADGVGYLAPIAPLTDPNRAAENRRVEVVLMSE